MANTYITTATTTPLSIDGSDGIYVAPTGSIVSDSGTITASGSGNYINIDGFVVSGSGTGVRLSGSSTTVYIGINGRVTNLNTSASGFFDTGTDNSIIIDGSLVAGFPIGLQGDGGSLINRGFISGNNTGISAHAVGMRDDNVSVLNEGSITSVGDGITNFGFTISNATISNTGTVSGDIGVSMLSGTGLSLVNSGTISGLGGTAIESSMVNTQVENSGIIVGDVMLTGNGVVYQGRADGVVLGDVIGGNGDDEMTGASEEDYFQGNAGEDDLRGRGGDDIVEGGADNDVLSGNTGDDRVDGNQGDDTLFGNRGDDIVRGGSGDDRIVGGRGNDVLTGNSGRDVFVFNRRTDDDIIMDYRNNFDQLDLTAFGLENVSALRSAGGILENGAGSIIDLTVIGGDGVIYVDDMAATDWTGVDFIL